MQNKIETSEETLLTETEAAALLTLSPKTLKRWRYEGIGPDYLKVGGRAVRYRGSDLSSFINENEDTTMKETKHA